MEADTTGRSEQRVIQKRMLSRATPLERAFDLARSGRFRKLEDIKRTLKSEGYSLEQLTGTSLARQLRQTMKEATEQPAQD